MSDVTTDFFFLTLLVICAVCFDIYRLKAESTVLLVHTDFSNQPKTTAGPVPRRETQDIRLMRVQF